MTVRAPARGASLACFAACVAAVWLAPSNGRTEDAPPPAPALRAYITLSGPRPAATAVREVTSELLAREHVEVSWATRTSFEPQDIFERGPEATAAVIGAWVDLSEPEQARLYFHDARSDRFFLRSLPLPRGIDELAKEEIAHIVANAVAALGKGSGESLTRTEARAALQAPAPAPRPVAAPATRALRGSAALLAGGRRLAPELPLVAEASVLLALAHRLAGQSASALGGWAGLGYQRAAEHRHEAIATEVSALSLRAGLLWTRALRRRLTLGLAAAAGADRVRYAPRAPSEGIIPAPASAFWVPALACFAALDVHLVAGLALTAQLRADVLLEKVHFDLHDSAGRTARVLELDTFRPGAALGLAYAF